jgi:oligopeptide transport system ATP-binding protein
MSLLDVKDLKTYFYTDSGVAKAVDGVTFSVDKGKVLGIVGESGCGKSVTSLSIMRLVDPVTGKNEGGEILFDGTDILKLPEPEMRKLRGNRISMIFQEPMTSLNPVFTIGYQIEESLILHKGMDKKAARQQAIHLLELVGIPEAGKRVDEYPHQLSGGMRQRVMIAMALACEPDILIADEPTTALDVTIQAQILELMQDLQKRLGMAIIMVTHDLGVIADMCDKIVVMYGGSICERGTADDIFYHAKHEYTKGLLRSIPNVNNSKERLIPISGTPINLLNMPKGCAFCSRCDKAMKICLEQKPEELSISDTHKASCWMNVKEMLEKQAGGAQA